ncbi:MAG: sortase [Clostridia bacterium]|nr:sortase [Clostridia bacterium]
MFESKYGKALTIGLVLLIVIVIGVLIFFTIDYIKSVNTNNEALHEANKFINEVKSPEKNNTISNETDTNSQTNVILNIQTENIISGGDADDTYKGFKKAGVIEIPKINLNYIIVSEVDSDSIEVAIAIQEQVSAGLNKVGNTVLVSHNYKNGTLFSNINNLVKDDKIYITDKTGTKQSYTIYDIYTTGTGDSEYMERDTNGQKEITLVTCTNETKSRLVICAKAD